MSKEIDILVEKEFEENLEKFMKKEIDSFSAKHLSLGDVISRLTKKGFVDKEDLDTNGWQWDFWTKMTHPDLGKIMLSGSGYYGGLDISIADDDEE